MARNLFRHVLYILINIVIIAILLQVGINVTRQAFDFGREFIQDFLSEDNGAYND